VKGSCTPDHTIGQLLIDIRKAGVNRIHIITSGVKDINKSLKFNRDGLSFTTTVAEDNPSIVFLKSERATLALCPREALA